MAKKSKRTPTIKDASAIIEDVKTRVESSDASEPFDPAMVFPADSSVDWAALSLKKLDVDALLAKLDDPDSVTRMRASLSGSLGGWSSTMSAAGEATSEIRAAIEAERELREREIVERKFAAMEQSEVADWTTLNKNKTPITDDTTVEDVIELEEAKERGFGEW